MIAATTSAEGLGTGAISYFQQLQGTGSVAALSGSQGAGGPDQSSASTSPLGQLLSNLQQLQSQDPTKFQQVVSTISAQLQTAAQQQGQTPLGTFLSNLASKFQSVASGGSLSQLQPHHRGHGHHHAYAQTQDAPTSASAQALLGGASPGFSQTTANASLQQLFTSLATEVSQALAG
jgi:hypothetical protein